MFDKEKADYIQAETVFQFHVSRIGSVAARQDKPELALRVTETFAALAATGIESGELNDLYIRVRENVFLPHDQTIELVL